MELRRHQRGFTLIELLMTVAIMGLLASMAVPFMRDYTVQARVTEGVQFLSEMRRRIEVEYNDTNALPATIPGTPTPSGQLFGGPWWSYSSLTGQAGRHDMWERVEYQIKGPFRVLVLRAYRKPEWANSDIGIHLQIKEVGGERLEMRCVVNNDETRMRFVPSTCRGGSADDWTSW
ncbi:MAG: hypothetical protein RLZZ385_294 [Pseudomonadota bacterium]|jgi:prepilin-type N-terminal cleavage/methylation domain-containing protein